jgi:hypothetical protein
VGAGLVADHVGVRVWFVMGGVIITLIAVSAFFIPPIIHIEDQEPGRSSAEGEVAIEADVPEIPSLL